VLLELKITDFATIETLNLTFNSNFNVLTGETGAGKSIILDAMIMLLGGRGGSNFIRSGSKLATIEAIFKLSEELQSLLNPILEEEGLDDDPPDRLILARELRVNGRSFCRVNGRTVNVGLLTQIARPLIDIHGQNEHLSLMRVPQHQRLLDRYAGLDGERNALTKEVKKLYRVRQELNDLIKNERELARQLDQLTFQVEEIDAASLKPGEDAELEIERNRLSNAEQLSQLAGEAYSLLVEVRDEEQFSISDLLGQTNRLFNQLVKLDSSLEKHSEILDNINYQIEELAEVLRNYSDEIEFQPNRLQDVEERLYLIFNLKRKYGDSIENILEYVEKARTKIETITHSEERVAELQKQEDTMRHQIGELALKLSMTRQQAGQKLGKEIVRQLADLGMEHTEFSVQISWKDDPAGLYVAEIVAQSEGQKRTLAFDERGIDHIEFLISPNPGEPLKPLVKVASGGETSRVMLALKTVLATADETPSLIFDEIDQGIGGRVGGVVGRKLWELSTSGSHQVLCVTHLPQIAGYADTHYHVSKKIVAKRTNTIVRSLEQDDQVEELALMLGGVSNATRASAREILAEAKVVKSQN
jgi:DNA repair protein RecN (Recombination protein N)